MGAQHISSKLIASYYILRGGVSFYDIYCGIFCARGDTTNLSTNWICAAALSRVHIILFVVVLLAMVLFVVHSVFMIALLLIFPTGAVVLLYHLNCTHYTARGGNSGDDVLCGTFYVVASYAAGHAGWFRGAALSLVHIILLVVDILNVVLLLECLL